MLNRIAVGPLTLRHASKRPGGVGGQREYDVMFDGKVIGRIWHAYGGASVPPDRPWMWLLTDAAPAPDVSDHGFAASRDAAEAALSRQWRKSLKAAHRSTT
jgi:hypothetical protein